MVSMVLGKLGMGLSFGDLSKVVVVVVVVVFVVVVVIVGFPLN